MSRWWWLYGVWMMGLVSQAEEVKLGDLLVDTVERSVTIPVEVNQRSGIVEFFLVHEQGKVHEASFKTSCSPVEVNAALRLLGLSGDEEGHERAASREDLSQSAKVKVEVWHPTRADWVRADAFISYAGSHQSEGAYQWAYIGSYFHTGRFMAKVEGDLISIYTASSALIQLDHPDRDDDRQWTAKVPQDFGDAEETKLKVTIVSGGES